MGKEVKNVVRTVLIAEGGLVAVGRRSQEENSDPGKWCIVGGKARKRKWLPGEALREVSEEVGIPEEQLAEIDEPLFVRRVQRTVGDTIWRTLYYFMEFDICLVPLALRQFNRAEFDQLEFIDQEGMQGKDFAYPSDVIMLNWFFEEVGL